MGSPLQLPIVSWVKHNTRLGHALSLLKSFQISWPEGCSNCWQCGLHTASNQEAQRYWTVLLLHAGFLPCNLPQVHAVELTLQTAAGAAEDGGRCGGCRQASQAPPAA